MARLSPALIAALLRALSSLSLEWQRRLGAAVGRLVWWLQLEGARTTTVNLTACFSELDREERRRLGRRSVEHTAMVIAEAGAVYCWPRDRWRGLTVSTEGVELLEQAREAGRGVLILVPHFGNWEYLALVLGDYGVTALYDPPRLGALEPVIRRGRNRAGANLLPIDGAGLRSFYRALAEGGVAALLPDQVPERRAGVYASFFGRPALTMTFANRLLRRTQAQVLLGAAVRCPGGFRVRFLAIEGALRSADQVASADAMNRAIETLVRTDPSQYQWEYKRFKRQLRDEDNPYPRRRSARRGRRRAASDPAPGRSLRRK